MKRVLVVDDEFDLAEAAQLILEAEGYEVITAGDGLEALHRLEEHQPDLVLTDMMMPRLDGRGMIEQMQAHPRWREIPVVLMSAVRPALPAGTRSFLKKPFDLDELTDTVNTQLQRVAEARAHPPRSADDSA